MRCLPRTTAGAALIGAVMLALAACGGGGSGGGSGGSGGASVPLVVPGTWAVLGSSTPAGAGATSGHGWVSLLGAAYAARGVVIVNLASGGSMTYQGLPSTTPPVAGRPAPDPVHNIDAALARTPTLVIVSYPSNDEAAGYSADETSSNILAIRAAALGRGVPVVVTSTQPRRTVPTAQQAATAARVDALLAQGFGPCFVDVRSALAPQNNTLDPRFDSGDGQHLNDAGHAVVFDRVRTALESGQCVRVA